MRGLCPQTIAVRGCGGFAPEGLTAWEGGKQRLMNNSKLIEVESLRKYYPVTAGLLSRHIADVKAVDGVSFYIREGETLGLVVAKLSDLNQDRQSLKWCGESELFERR